MITVHHLENSRSQRVLWLLEELALPYEVKRYARHPETMLAPPELTRVHPLGKAPVITDDSAEHSTNAGTDSGTGGHITVAESGAIIEYLLDAHGGDGKGGRLRPPQGTAEQRRYTYWLHFAEGSAMPPLLMKLVFDKVRSAPVPFFIKPIVKGIADKVTNSFIGPNLQRQLDFMEVELSTRPWFAGNDFTAADIQMSFPLEAAQGRAGLNASRPKLMDWLARIHARPAYQRALQTGGPYSMAG